jgi:hypothetical protein
MSHVRTQIRVALAALIGSIDDLTGRVVSDPTEIVDADAGPWAEVAVGPEQIGVMTLGAQGTGRRQARQVSLFAEIHTRGKAAAIEKAEDLCAQIEAKVYNNARLGGLLISPMTLVLIQPQAPDMSGSQPNHTLRLQWNSTYSTAESNASVAI